MVLRTAGTVATNASAGANSSTTQSTTSVTTGTSTPVVASTTLTMAMGFGSDPIETGKSGKTTRDLSGSIGSTVLGVTEEQTSALYTFDCWKSVLHDQSTEPSNGKILREIAADPRIKEITIASNDSNVDLPHLVLKNIWDEEFRIDYIYLPSIGLAAHAVRI